MSTKEISERESRERKDKFKELRDMKKEERDRTVEDKDSISSLASGLEFPGFSEAGEQIRTKSSRLARRRISILKVRNRRRRIRYSIRRKNMKKN